MDSFISPGHGQELAPGRIPPGCCGIVGPDPSATRDKGLHAAGKEESMICYPRMSIRGFYFIPRRRKTCADTGNPYESRRLRGVWWRVTSIPAARSVSAPRHNARSTPISHALMRDRW